jgi:integrase
MLHRALSDAVKWGYLPRNFAEDAQSPRVSRKRPTIWTPEQLGRFVRHVQDDRFYALWLLVTTTGFRRGELAGLLRDDVDLHRGRVSPSVTRVVVAGHVQESETKTQAGIRSLALDPDTLDALRVFIDDWERERHLLAQSTRLLFVWPDGRPLHPDTITALFHRHCDSAGLPRIRLHDVRHSYASAALKAGVPPKVISERLGHATVSFTLQTYAHVIPGMDEEAANSVAALILGSAGVDADGRKSGRQPGGSPLKKQLAWAKAQASDGSGGSVLVQDIVDTCLKTHWTDVSGDPGLRVSQLRGCGDEYQPLGDHRRCDREPTCP